jgi:hypothetical protein
MIKRSHKILLLLAAFYYAALAESQIYSWYSCDFATDTAGQIAATQLFVPDFSLYYPHIFTNYLSADTYSDKDFAGLWRLNLYHFNRYVAHQFARFSQNPFTDQQKLSLIHTKNILYIKESDDIPLFLI